MHNNDIFYYMCHFSLLKHNVIVSYNDFQHKTPELQTYIGTCKPIFTVGAITASTMINDHSYNIISIIEGRRFKRQWYLG